MEWDVSRLSNGERQRLAMARVLAQKPEVMLLDEPTSGLDAETVRAVEAVLQKYLQAGAGMLFVTHDEGQAGRLAERYLRVAAGRATEGVLIGLNALLFIWLRLKLERQLVIAALRMLVQLSLLALVLKTLFELASPIYTGLAALSMVLFASYEVLGHQQRRLAGWWGYGVGDSSILFARTIVTVFALTTQVRPDPWYHPQFALPLLSMILGNTMTGVALGLDTLSTRLARERPAI